jgi:hypothetical protein
LLALIIVLTFFIILSIYFFNKKERIENFSINIKEEKPKKLNKAIRNNVKYDLDNNIGKYYDNVILETFYDESAIGGSRIRVKPLNCFNENTRVSFPKLLREKNKLGSQFLASVKLCQNISTKTGLPNGKPYLVADRKSITLLNE